MTPEASWHLLRERGNLLGMRFVVWLYRLLGRRLCGIVILPVVGYIFLTGARARRASRSYLEQLHRWSGGRLPKSRRPTWWDGFLHFREFGLNILDRVGFWLGDAGRFELIVHGQEHLTRLHRQGAILVSAHLGSFDALRLYAAQAQVPVTVMMYVEHARMINAIFKRLTPTIDLRMIAPDPSSVGWLFELRKRIRDGEMIGILADRVGPREGRHVSVLPFLGVPAPFPQGPFLLATHLRCPLLLMVALRRDSRRYEIFVEPLGDGAPAMDAGGGAGELDGLVERFVRRLEFYCTRAPYQWFNFYDFWAGTASGPRDPGPGARAPEAAGRGARS